jgi:hypothetical protein
MSRQLEAIGIFIWSERSEDSKSILSDNCGPQHRAISLGLAAWGAPLWPLPTEGARGLSMPKRTPSPKSGRPPKTTRDVQDTSS